MDEPESRAYGPKRDGRIPEGKPMSSSHTVDVVGERNRAAGGSSGRKEVIVGKRRNVSILFPA